MAVAATLLIAPDELMTLSVVGTPSPSGGCTGSGASRFSPRNGGVGALVTWYALTDAGVFEHASKSEPKMMTE